MDIDIEEVALFAKRSEIACLKKAEEMKSVPGGFSYWEAKAQAFSQVWEYIVFSGRKVGEGVSPEQYNQENEIWSKRVE